MAGSAGRPTRRATDSSSGSRAHPDRGKRTAPNQRLCRRTDAPEILSRLHAFLHACDPRLANAYITRTWTARSVNPAGRSRLELASPLPRHNTADDVDPDQADSAGVRPGRPLLRAGRRRVRRGRTRRPPGPGSSGEAAARRTEDRCAGTSGRTRGNSPPPRHARASLLVRFARRNLSQPIEGSGSPVIDRPTLARQYQRVLVIQSTVQHNNHNSR